MVESSEVGQAVTSQRLDALELTSSALAHEPQEEIPCPLCEANAPVPDLVVHDRLMWRPGEYQIVRCGACSMRYLSPRPTIAALHAHYPDDYFIYRKPEDEPAWARPALNWYWRKQWKVAMGRIEAVVGKFTPETRLVDVGCGMNHLLATAKKLRGCEGIGVDFKSLIVDYVRNVRGMQCVHGGLHDGRFADASFDLVIMNEYLEHEPNPREVLREARRVTKPGGHISVEIPYSDSLVAQLFGARWTQIDAPRHLMHFTRRTLTAMLERSGYEVVHMRTFHAPFMIGLSAVQWLGAKHVGGPTPFQLLAALAAAMPFFLAYPWIDEFVHVVARAA